MDSLDHGRLTILPPPPSRPRELLALVSAIWFGALARLRQRVADLARLVRLVYATARSRWAPEPAAPTSVSEPGVSALLASLQRDPHLCQAGASGVVRKPALRGAGSAPEAVTRVG